MSTDRWEAIPVEASSSSGPAVADGRWCDARDSARPLADAAQGFGGSGVGSWDYRLVYDLVTLVWYVRAVSTGRSVPQVGLGEVFCLLASGPEAVTAACTAVLGAPAQTTAGGDDPAAVWHRSSMRWDEDRRPDARCGIAAGRPRGTGVEIGAGWAASAVAAGLLAERGGWPARTPVTVIDGSHSGRQGLIRSPAWRADHSGQSIADGPPDGYQVTMDGVDGEHLLLSTALRARPAEGRTPPGAAPTNA